MEQENPRITDIIGISLPSHNASTFLHDLRLEIVKVGIHEIGSDIQASLTLGILTFSTAKYVKSLCIMALQELYVFPEQDAFIQSAFEM